MFLLVTPANLPLMSDLQFRAVRTTNAQFLECYPTAAHAIAFKADIAAETARRLELTETACARMDACVAEILAGHKPVSALEQVIAEQDATDRRAA